MAKDPTQELARSIAEDCLALRVRQAGRVISAIYEKELRPAGVTISQFNLLVALACGLRSAKDLGQRLQLEKSTVSRNLERMAAQGWLETRTARDGRSSDLHLTAAGRSQLRAAYPAWKRGQAAAEGVLGAGALDRLNELARALR